MKKQKWGAWKPQEMTRWFQREERDMSSLTLSHMVLTTTLCEREDRQHCPHFLCKETMGYQFMWITCSPVSSSSLITMQASLPHIQAPLTDQNLSLQKAGVHPHVHPFTQFLWCQQHATTGDEEINPDSWSQDTYTSDINFTKRSKTGGQSDCDWDLCTGNPQHVNWKAHGRVPRVHSLAHHLKFRCTFFC